MNRIVCQVCTKQFRTGSGLDWHVKRIHDRNSPGDAAIESGDSFFAQGSPATPVEVDREQTLAGLRAELERLEDFAESLDDELVEHGEANARDIKGVWQGLIDVRQEVWKANDAIVRLTHLSTDVRQLASTIEEMSHTLGVVARLVWVLDKPNRRAPLQDALSGLEVGPDELHTLRERIKRFLSLQDN